MLGQLLPKACGLLLLIFLTTSTARIDRNQPHAHKGLLKPYQPGPFSIKLTPGDEAQLAAGHSVMKQTAGSGTGGGAICVQDIDAPKAAVWNQILDLESYTKKVPKVVQCANYFVSRKASHSQNLKTKMVLGVLPGYSYESYYDHHFYPNQDSMVWTLDYDKTSDMDDVSGHWHVEETPAGRTRVYYACDIKLKASVPGPIFDYLSKSALKTATAWVKKESEKHPDDTAVAEFYHYKVTPRKVHTPDVNTQKEPELVGSGLSRFFRRGGAFQCDGNSILDKIPLKIPLPAFFRRVPKFRSL